MNPLRVHPAAIAATLAVLAGCGVNPGAQLQTGQASLMTAQAVPGQIMVKMKPGLNTSSLISAQSQLGLKALPTNASIAKLGWKVMAYDAGKIGAQSLLTTLSQNPGVAAVEPRYTLQLPKMQLQPQGDVQPVSYNDPMAKDQYALVKGDTARAHAITMGSAKTILSIVDTGVDWDHPDFQDADKKSRVAKGRDHVANNDNPRDGHGHGTHCAGSAAASVNNGEGVVGVAANVTILAEKVLSDYGSGSYDSVAGGIVHAADMGAKVISMSLGGSSTAKVLEDAVAYAISKDALLVAAMGNDGREKKSYPAALPGVMAVGSTDSADRRSSFSNMGSHISVGAPGSAILSTLPTFKNQIGKTDYGTLSGTSMATPFVAGIAALVRDLHPDWDYKAVQAKVEKAAEDLGTAGFDKEFGHGRVNAYRALLD
ncbi:MAG: peptidase S8 [Candidatus Sericytochromatia bacterium]|nr:peptidase S8 [Candidatus Tanganyikabacteria bacterium]